ncbi:sigma-70 family RNA polymerase sigma factor [Nocardioides pacificus]
MQHTVTPAQSLSVESAPLIADVDLDVLTAAPDGLTEDVPLRDEDLDDALAEAQAQGDARLSRARRQELTALLLQRASVATDEQVRDAALDHVVVLNMVVARSMAARHRDKGIPIEDLEQVAYLALIRAARQFDTGREHNFLSYAVPTIRGELRKYFRDLGWTVRPPRRVQEIQSRVVAARATLAQGGGPVPTVAQIAASIDEDEESVAEALSAEGCFFPTSLDRPMGEDSSMTLGDSLVHDDESEREAAEARVVLRPVVRRLRERDRRILQLRYFEGCTQQEIADEIGVTQMQVSRLLTRILRDLGSWLGEDEDLPTR